MVLCKVIQVRNGTGLWKDKIWKGSECSDIYQRLGTTVEMFSDDSESHLAKLRQYVECGGDKPGLPLWPIVDRVEVQCRSPLLSTGVVLVDLPPTGNARVARYSIGENRWERYARLVAVVPIDQAMNSKRVKSAWNNIGLVVESYWNVFSSRFVWICIPTANNVRYSVKFV